MIGPGVPAPGVVALGVLDQSPIPDGSTAADALRDTIELARAAERLGYRRYWLAEHHNTASLAGSSPEVLACAVASQTSTIRVGAGGILLSHYSALKVAETFRTLEALFPGRIDLALGRHAGTDDEAADALRHGPGGSGVLGDEHYPQRVADVVGFLHGTLGPDHPFAAVLAMPGGPTAPQLSILSSSSYGAGLAARMGLPLCFAQFISPRFGAQVVAGYRRQFTPSWLCPAPVVRVAVNALCADTDAEAERLAMSGDVWALHDGGPLLSPGAAAARPLSDLEFQLVAQQRERRAVGAPDRVRAILLNLAEAYAVDELVVRTVTHDPAARLRSYALLADAFDLDPPG